MASAIHPTARAGWSGQGAEDYETGRPGYPQAAVMWIGAELGIGVTGPNAILDLAAGTGKLTRELISLGAEVIAVEPVAAMRAQLAAAVPSARVLEGTAERIPLGDGAVHAVVVAQAFHWFDVPAAAAEIARVLDCGGGLAIVRNEWDGDAAEWVPALGDYIRDAWREPPTSTRDWRSQLDATGIYEPFAERVVPNNQHGTLEILVARVASMSYIAALPDEERAQVLDGARALLPRPRSGPRRHRRRPDAHGHPLGAGASKAMIDSSARADRLVRLRAAMDRSGVALTAIAPTDNLRWLTGFAPLYDERACLLLVGSDREAMVMPSLNAEQTAGRLPEVELVRWVDEDGSEAALRDALARVAPGEGPVAADPEMRADHLLALQRATGGRATIDGARLLGALREIKDGAELTLLAASSQIADLAIQAAWAACAPGASERQVAETIDRVFRDHGCEPEFAIVAAGVNGAFPHHQSGPAELATGDAVVIDVGAIRDGYHSDITRMAFLGEPTARYREVHAAVETAVVAAMAATRPGARSGEVDAAARGAIAAAGYGGYFVHRTGHGLGLSGHEGPYVMDGSDVVLSEGMVHSIEPGIYLPGEFGVRLEEIVYVTAGGCVRFSDLDRAVHVVS